MPVIVRCLTALLLASFLQPVLAAPTPVAPPPKFDARSWILMDASSGRVITSHDADQQLEPASLTKLMTAYVVFQALRDGKINLDTPVPVSEHAWRSEGSRTFLKVGSHVTVLDLLQGMIVQSGNDASIALAEAVAGTEASFAGLMNMDGERLGMKYTHFVNATGLPAEGHVSTARDMAILARAIVTEFPNEYRFYSQRKFTWNNITQANRNGLLERDPSVDGMKTGHTEEAGYCLVASAKRQGMRLISVVMGTDSFKAREDSSLALLNYGFSFFETKRLFARGAELAHPRIYGADGGTGIVGLRSDLYATVPRGRIGEVKVQVVLKPHLAAPITANTPVGRVQATLDGKLVAVQELYPLQGVARGGLFRRGWDTIASWFG